MKSFSKKQNKNGFSILEVIVAVGIITIGIIPIISLFTMNLNSEIKNKNVLIAAYLANESIEIVRQERDDNWTAGVDWMTNISADGSEIIVSLINANNIREGWTIETPDADGKKIYLSGDDSYVQRNSAPGIWEETPFERYLTITAGTAGCSGLGVEHCVEITSYVSFNGTSIAEITTYLYNDWK